VTQDFESLSIHLPGSFSLDLLVPNVNIFSELSDNCESFHFLLPEGNITQCMWPQGKWDFKVTPWNREVFLFGIIWYGMTRINWIKIDREEKTVPGQRAGAILNRRRL
jgi:hypothetical protein